MADFSKYFPIVLKWEGGWADDPLDKGGKTNMGVTLKVWEAWATKLFGIPGTEETLRKATKEQISKICKVLYWDILKCDEIKHQGIAAMIADWGWGSGPVTAAKKVQAVLGVGVDGKFGAITIGRINNFPDQQDLYYQITEARKDFLKAIIARDPSQKRFEEGWFNRVNDLYVNGNK